MRLLVDTSAFVALEDRDDQNHRSALEYREKIRQEKTSFRALYTSNYIIDETITLLRMQLGHAAAVSFGETIRSSEAIKILWVDRQGDAQAWEVFKKHRDKHFSYTDCTSFVIMSKEAIRTAFTFDRHFSQYGLQMVP